MAKSIDDIYVAHSAERIAQYKKNKHTGGSANEKGNRYEAYYATYAISELYKLFVQSIDILKNVYVISQSKEFVDDLVIVVPEKNKCYYQLKDTDNLSWTTRQHGFSLEDNFILQISENQRREGQFSLYLVTSNTKIINSAIPESIDEYTSVEFFPSTSSINELILCHNTFKENLRSILMDHATDDMVSNCATAILGIWQGIGSEPNSSLKDQYDRLFGMRYMPLKTSDKIILSDVITELFDKFGISYQTNDKMLLWNYGCFEGALMWNEEIENILQKRNFEDVFSVINVLNN